MNYLNVNTNVKTVAFTLKLIIPSILFYTNTRLSGAAVATPPPPLRLSVRQQWKKEGRVLKKHTSKQA